jgi:hypothetical protein
MEGHSRVPGNPAIPPTFPIKAALLLHFSRQKQTTVAFQRSSSPQCPPCSPMRRARTHFINSRESRSRKALARRATRRVVVPHARSATRPAPFWAEPGGSGLFGRIAALRIWVKTPSLDPNSRLALHPKRDSLALAPIYEMSSTLTCLIWDKKCRLIREYCAAYLVPRT